MSGTYGDGVGHGGGTGGSIRDAGGIFGRMEAAREGEYFLKKVDSVYCFKTTSRRKKCWLISGST